MIKKWLRFKRVITVRLLIWTFLQSHKLNLTYCLCLPCYLHFAFCLFVWLIKLKCTPHYLTIRTLTLPREFMFVFIRFFIGAILLEKSCQKHGVSKKYKKWDSHIGELSIEGGFQLSAHYDIEGWKRDLGALNYWRYLN